jgi:hypothetical protein
VNDGARTRDLRHHKPALYQLSYAHHASDVAIGPPEAYPPGRVAAHAVKSAVTFAAAAWASSEVGPGSAVNTVAR